MSDYVSHFFRADLDPRDEKIRRLEAQNKLMREALEGINAYVNNMRSLELDNAPYVSLFRVMTYELPESIQETLTRCNEVESGETVQELEK